MAWRWGLWALRILQIPLFRNPKKRRLLRVPQFGPQNQAMGMLKSPGTPFRACVCRAFWRYNYLRAVSGVDTWAPGIKSDWYLRHPCRLWLLSCLRATPVMVGSGSDSSRGPFPQSRPRGSYERGSRSTLVYWLEIFFQLRCIVNLDTWTQ